jgi:2-C-methyl-D-erythritol 4-phosphate cytidylyltransferase/2-C-methyl-D-erythritol 2,4-cyclodiphosphate synthase
VKNIAIIVAAGNSTRFNYEIPKQYFVINGKTVLNWTIKAFLASDFIDNVLVVINNEHRDLYYQSIEELNILNPIIGGKTRNESVFLGLKALEEFYPENVLIHDAARPLISTKLIDKVVLQLKNHSVVDVGISLNDTIKHNDENGNITILDREKLYATQTPQGFKYKTILDLHKQNNIDHTDDISLCIKNDINVCKIEGDRNNVKITNTSDIEFCKHIMGNVIGDEKIYRTGIGIDVHRFSQPFDKNIEIKICGIGVEHNQSIIAHSDGDVGFHSITEALLGSMALGNIGQLFPPNDEKYKNMDSTYFLECAKNLLRKAGAKIINIDLTIICEKPKIMPHSKVMRDNIAKILEIHANMVSVKATTTEKMGFLGTQEGIAAQAVCSVVCNKLNDE